MKTTVENLDANVAGYNSLVKPAYRLNATGMEYLINNEISEDAETPYHEISSSFTQSGHAEIFEPEITSIIRG